jgi:hypothetical protein
MTGRKWTILRSFDAHWRALSNGNGATPWQAFHRRVEMKNWPFAGLKIGSTNSAVKKWPDDFSMTPPLKPQWEALSSGGNTTINNFHNLDDDIKLDNIVIVTIKTTTASLRAKALHSMTSCTLYHTVSLRARALRSTITSNVLQTEDTGGASVCWYFGTVIV